MSHPPGLHCKSEAAHRELGSQRSQSCMSRWPRFPPTSTVAPMPLSAPSAWGSPHDQWTGRERQRLVVRVSWKRWCELRMNCRCPHPLLGVGLRGIGRALSRERGLRSESAWTDGQRLRWSLKSTRDKVGRVEQGVWGKVCAWTVGGARRVKTCLPLRAGSVCCRRVTTRPSGRGDPASPWPWLPQCLGTGLVKWDHMVQSRRLLVCPRGRAAALRGCPSPATSE